MNTLALLPTLLAIVHAGPFYGLALPPPVAFTGARTAYITPGVVNTVAAPFVNTVAAPVVNTVAAPVVKAVAAPVEEIAVPSVTSSQFNSADEVGNYAFGYQNVNGQREESGNIATGIRGSYTNAWGRVINYVADDNGFMIV